MSLPTDRETIQKISELEIVVVLKNKTIISGTNDTWLIQSYISNSILIVVLALVGMVILVCCFIFNSGTCCKNRMDPENGLFQ